jgi:hypothetical protein
MINGMPKSGKFSIKKQPGASDGAQSAPRAAAAAARAPARPGHVTPFGAGNKLLT